MAIRNLTIASALLVLGLVAFGRLAGGSGETLTSDPAVPPSTPQAELSEDIVDGHIAAQIFVAADLNYRLDITFAPLPDSPLSTGTRPSVSFAMTDEHMDGVNPPLAFVVDGQWRAIGQLPKPGNWVVSVGLGDDFAEMQFSAP